MTPSHCPMKRTTLLQICIVSVIAVAVVLCKMERRRGRLMVTYILLCLEVALPSSPILPPARPSSLLPLLASSPSSLFPLSPSSLSPLHLFSLTGMCWFKPSVQKKGDALRFVPCNLHIQKMRVQSNSKGTRYHTSLVLYLLIPQPHPPSQPPPFKLGEVWEWAPSIRTAWE